MTAETHENATPRGLPDWVWYAGLPLAAIIWWALYSQLIPFSEWVTALFPVDRNSHTGEAIAFFVYDVPKVLLLLTGIVFVTGVLRSWFSPEKTRVILAGKRQIWGYPLGAMLGVFTPFCSCSSVPLFIGFVSAGIPLGVTFSFLIAGPMVGPVGLGLLYGLVGWKIATIYLVFGFTIATVAGLVLGRMGLERYLQDWVRELNTGPVGDLPEERLTLADRLKIGALQVREIVGKVWIWVLVGIGIGAAIHGYVPEEMMLRIMGGEAWWSVPAAVVVGVPMYTNAAGVIPIVEALLGKGAALGTTLAFMMSVIALSLPEMIILKQVLTYRLIAIFIAVVSAGILATGFLFNVIM
ncbi:permease [Lutimaribacter sp. EGI FJ00015]|uniref:Permease n=1 Tax=Lutimaribacter degradans TaxID=2945989 RepID=A0ACC5ZYC9_9RHOB|nr:permease [Lutimaribacter sp. EGI FJ00013]MCM2563351.1 permease [Lutimaribacter sp. EGI FJ00013]MCO0614571.1 permease [Lutimaribacter sp. EGI FJ00015]MCO0637243.1 permease [Lutimaribacter sp. EGI FJ00014]